MRELPILFNTEMVQAITAGRKTATRRLVRAKSRRACGFYVTSRKSDGTFMGVYDYDDQERQFDNPQTPPAQVGDLLYIRETWAKWSGGYAYKAQDPLTDHNYPAGCERWKPSIHMPKAAARIWLKVTAARVEKLQDMEMEDNRNYIAEGAADRHDFIRIWDATVNDESKQWYGNPWVWVIEFERCERPEGE